MSEAGTDYREELDALCGELESAREALLRLLSGLTDEGFRRARRGGWPVDRVLEHVIESEWGYVRLIGRLCGSPPDGSNREAVAAGSADRAREELGASRAALLAVLGGVDEETFYRLQALGREEYSVMSVLENVRNHDIEHADQIRQTIAAV